MLYFFVFLLLHFILRGMANKLIQLDPLDHLIGLDWGLNRIKGTGVSSEASLLFTYHQFSFPSGLLLFHFLSPTFYNARQIEGLWALM